MTNPTQVERGRLRARRALLAISTVLASGVAVPAIAQVAGGLAPTRQSIDANGIDLFRGSMNVDGPTLSAGSGEAPDFAWKQVNRGGGWVNNTLISLMESAGTGEAFVNFGDRSDRFSMSGTTFTPAEGNGSTLSLIGTTYTYTTADGTVIHFKRVFLGGTAGDFIGLISDITKPTGTKLTFTQSSMNVCIEEYSTGGTWQCFRHQDIYRVTQIDSTSGYRMAVGYPALSTPDPNHLPPLSFFETFYTPSSATLTNTLVAGTPRTQSFVPTAVGGTSYYSITDPMGRTTQYRMDGIQVAGIKRPGSSTEDVIVGYSGGKVASVTTAAGTTSYGYVDAAGVRTTTVTDPLSHTTTYKFNIASQRMTQVTIVPDTVPRSTAMEYDASGRLTKVTAPEGNYTQYTYDTRGNVTQTLTVSKTPGTPADIVTTALFPSSCTTATKATCNKPTWTKDAKGNQTDYTYDTTTGNVLTVTAPPPNPANPTLRPKTTYSYTTVGGVQLVSGISVCRTTASCAGATDETKTTIGYNGNLLPTTVTQAAGNGSVTVTTTLGYDSVGNQISVDGPLAGTADTTTYRYNADRELVGVISADPDGSTGIRKRQATRLTRDDKGRVTLTEAGTVADVTDAAWSGFAPAQTLATVYDGVDRKTSETLKSGATSYGSTLYSYDHQRLNTVTIAMNGAGADRVTKYGYDNADRITKVTTGYGTTAAADDVTATYTSNGQVATVADAKSNLTTYEYDGFDRLVKTRYPSPTAIGTSSTTDYEQLVLDPNGNVTSLRQRGYAADSTRHIDYTYDALDRVTAKDVPSGAYSDLDATYEYDLLGHLTRAVGAGWMVNAFGYDALGRLVSDQKYGGTTTYTYDAAGRRTRMTWSDGFYVDYDYDVTGNVTRIRENGATSGAGVLATYAYDDLGRRMSLTRGNGVVTSYGYDPVSRLASLTNELPGTAQDLTVTLAYNWAEQITSRTASNDAHAWTGAVNVDRTYTVNGLNQYGAAGGVSFGYDARGNLISSGATTYTYTAENRLATLPANGASLGYEPAGGELLQLYTGDGTDRRFVTSGGQIISERVGSALVGRYVFGPGADEPLVSYDASGNRSWLIADERGSIIAKTNAVGTATAIASYDEYGIPAGGDVGRFGYTGQAYLREIGLSYYKARIYSPTLGRFLQTDPIGYADGLNLYAYVQNDPMNYTDPTGLDAWCGSGGTAIWGGGGVYGDTVTADFRCSWDRFTLGWGSGAGSGGGRGVVASRGGDTGSADAVNRPKLPQMSEPIYLTDIDCSMGVGMLHRAGGNALVDVGGYGTAIGGTGVAVGTGLGIGGALTGNIPMAGFGAIVSGLSAPIAAGGATMQGIGAVAAFGGGESSRTLVKNASAAVINRIPLAPDWLKSGLKFAAKHVADYVPDVRTCRSGH